MGWDPFWFEWVEWAGMASHNRAAVRNQYPWTRFSPAERKAYSAWRADEVRQARRRRALRGVVWLGLLLAAACALMTFVVLCF